MYRFCLEQLLSTQLHLIQPNTFMLPPKKVPLCHFAIFGRRHSIYYHFSFILQTIHIVNLIFKQGILLPNRGCTDFVWNSCFQLNYISFNLTHFMLKPKSTTIILQFLEDDTVCYHFSFFFSNKEYRFQQGMQILSGTAAFNSITTHST